MMHSPLFQIFPQFPKNFRTFRKILKILPFPEKFLDFHPPTFFMTFLSSTTNFEFPPYFRCFSTFPLCFAKIVLSPYVYKFPHCFRQIHLLFTYFTVYCITQCTYWTPLDISLFRYLCLFDGMCNDYLRFKLKRLVLDRLIETLEQFLLKLLPIIHVCKIGNEFRQRDLSPNVLKWKTSPINICFSVIKQQIASR